MADLEVLWLDDDSPAKMEGYDGVRIQTAQSCAQAEKLLNSRSTPPHWAVIDLIVPQGDWGGAYYPIPGLMYIEHLKKKYADQIRIFAFSIAMTPETKMRVKAAGAVDAFAKLDMSWADILRTLQASQA